MMNPVLNQQLCPHWKLTKVGCRLLIDENVLHDLIDDVLSPYYSLSSHSLGSLVVNYDMKAQTYNFSRPNLEFLY
jgi:hypothetical protein